MLHQTFNWESHNENLFGQYWTTNASSPKAVIAIVHGHGELSDRYDHVAAFFNAQGMHVIAFDHFGHGKSSGKRGHIPSYEAVMDSMDEFLQKSSQLFPSLPTFLYGHSMGGNFVANYAMHRRPVIQGVILTGPWFRLAFKPSSIDVFLAKAMGKVYPSFTQSSKLNPEHISRDKTEVKKYIENPLVHSMISPVLFMGCHQAGEWVVENAKKWDRPLLIMHGTDDQLTSFEASKTFVEKAQSDKITWKPWDGLYHELHHEPERQKVFKTMVDWIEKHLS